MYITIAGNIGSGKTSLTHILAERLGYTAQYEDSDNPYIGDFYEDMSRWSFNLQVYFLGKRLKQAIELAGTDNIVQDRTIYEDAHIFATNLHESGLMATRDYETYMEVFRLSSGLIRRPDLLVYLKADVPTLVSQIQRRGRAYEMSIQEEYLASLNKRYTRWIDEIYDGEVLTVDVGKCDFVLDPESLEKIVEVIGRKIKTVGK
jgi:deoxyadenosine/deoxycytidine kinase